MSPFPPFPPVHRFFFVFRPLLGNGECAARGRVAASPRAVSGVRSCGTPELRLPGPSRLGERRPVYNLLISYLAFLGSLLQPQITAPINDLVGRVRPRLNLRFFWGGNAAAPLSSPARGTEDASKPFLGSRGVGQSSSAEKRRTALSAQPIASLGEFAPLRTPPPPFFFLPITKMVALGV